MDLFTTLGLASIIALVLANAFFVATEFSIVAIRRSRLERLAAEGRHGARAAKDIVSHLDVYIAACQFGITLASLALGWIGEPALAHLIEPPLQQLFGRFAPAASHTIAISVAFAFITALHIVIGELAPKGLALQRTEGTALLIATPMQLFYRVFQWPILLLNAVGNGVLRLLGLRPASAHEMVHSVAELRFLLESMEEAGVMDTSEARIASRAFEFGDLTAGSIMTPRVMLEALPITSSLGQVVAWAKSTKHRRLLIYEGSLDHIIGLIHIGDIFKVSNDPTEEFDIHRLVRPVVTVPESKRADSLLEEMRAARQQLTVIVDEYRGTAGIVTMEDLVEALVGQIDEEPELEEDITPLAPHRQPDGSVLLDGLTRLEEVKDLVGIIPSEVENVRTLGGLVTYFLGRIPQVGETIETPGCILRVEQLVGNRVALVRVSLTRVASLQS
jgi:CBS domain containing-hemolysin-like protein